MAGNVYTVDTRYYPVFSISYFLLRSGKFIQIFFYFRRLIAVLFCLNRVYFLAYSFLEVHITRHS